MNDHELDDLLKTSFLELDPDSDDSSELMDKVSASVFSREWPEALPKNGSQASSVQVGRTGPWVWYLSACLLVLGLSYGAWAYYKQEKETPEKPAASTATLSENITPAVNSALVNNLHAGDEALANTGNAENSSQPHKTGRDAFFAHKLIAYAPAKEQNTSPGTAPVEPFASTPYSTSSALPVADTLPYPAPGSIDSSVSPKGEAIAQFTEKEKQQHARNVDQMLGNIAGLRFQDYSKITVEDKNLNIHTEFFLKRGEVTIRQYKLFLTDLLMRGEKNEYEVARPKPERIWTDPKDKNNKNFLVQYLSKASYEDYPVVCISPEGMELYCQWLKQEIEGYYKRNGTTVSLSVRLPYENEWKYAASEGKSSHRYATETGRIRAHVGGAYLANFAESQRKFVAEKDTVLAADKPAKDGPVTHKLSKNIFTAREGDYPSFFNLSNMSGNVSEVVMTKDANGTTMLRTIGGNWNSQKAFLKINAPDEFGGKVQASPYIGFRPLIMINN